MNAAGGRRRGVSLWLRLALFHAAGAVLVLATASLFLYWRARADLRQVEAYLVEDQLRLLRKAQALDLKSPGELNEQLGYFRTEGPLFPIYARVLDGTGQTIEQSPGMAEALPQSAFEAPSSAPPKRWMGPDGRAFLVAAAPLEPSARSKARFFEVGVDVTRENAFDAAYRRELLWVWLSGSLLSALIAAGVARRGLKPIADISAAVSNVSAGGLELRLDVGAWPSELRGLAGSLNGMLNRLEASFRRLSGFSAELAHELRTPLHALRTQAEVTLARARSTAEYQQTLENALEEYDRLTRMTENLLFLARADHAESHLERQNLEGLAEIRKILDYFEPLLDEKQLGVSIEGGTLLWADPGLLRRALTNLVSNAVKFSPKGGPVTVCLGRDGLGGAVVEIANSSAGITEENLRLMGTRFYRIDRPGEAPQDGFGLGLAIVRSIAELHGGALDVRGGPGQRVTVTLRLPAQAT